MVNDKRYVVGLATNELETERLWYGRVRLMLKFFFK